jgi:hypothetical protein
MCIFLSKKKKITVQCGVVLRRRQRRVSHVPIVLHTEN